MVGVPQEHTHKCRAPQAPIPALLDLSKEESLFFTGDNSRACPVDLNLQTPVFFPKHNGVRGAALIGVIGTIDPLFPFFGAHDEMASLYCAGAKAPARGLDLDQSFSFLVGQGVRFFSVVGGGAGSQSAASWSDRSAPLTADRL